MRSVEQTLALARAQGVITPGQMDALWAIAAEPAEGANPAPAPGAPQDDERLRLITGFADIFVTIGLGMFLGALSYFAGELGLAGRGAAVAVAAWLLAEFFTRRQRMALPSIVLFVVYAAAVFATVDGAVGGTASGVRTPSAPMPEHDLFAFAIAGLVTFPAAGLHYWRFRVPITPAAGAAALIPVVLGFAEVLGPDAASAMRPALLAGCGVAIFALAMAFDLSDPRRQTRRTDIAFWLHMLAAPLIVHSLLGRFTGGGNPGTDIAAEPILAVFFALGVVAVLVDRRALLVSGLAYAGFAFGALARGAGLSDSLPLTVLALGAFVLLLSAAWHPLRRSIFILLPRRFAALLPNPSITLPP
ncbi:hypothetical protein V5F53_19795 [Xanthobacter sp. V4C-4]|uniref:hypothetical protein n=1 Tax=Xanthobacter cornucopiae TaxID=3119924 RepID=UPI00372AD59F